MRSKGAIFTVGAIGDLPNIELLFNSLEETLGSDSEFFYFILDGESFEMRNAKCLSLTDLRINKSDFLEKAFCYGKEELCDAMKPKITVELLREFNEVIFIDALTLVFDDLAKALAPGKGAPVMLLPKILNFANFKNSNFSTKELLKSGPYSPLFYLARQESKEFFSYLDKRSKFKFGKNPSRQHYMLDRFLGFAPCFLNYYIIEEPHFFVTRQNCRSISAKRAGTEIVVSQQKIISINFRNRHESILASANRLYLEEEKRYESEVKTTSLFKKYKDYEYRFNKTSNGHLITLEMRTAYRDNLERAYQGLLPFPPNPVDGDDNLFFNWLKLPDRLFMPKLNKFEAAHYISSNSLKLSFPEVEIGKVARFRAYLESLYADDISLSKLICKPNDISEAVLVSVPSQNSPKVLMPFRCFNLNHSDRFGVNLIGNFGSINSKGSVTAILKEALQSSQVPFSSFEIFSSLNRIEKLEQSFRSGVNYPVNLIVANFDMLSSIIEAIGVEEFKRHYNIIVANWELEDPPAYAQRFINYVDEVWATSQFEKESFAKIFGNKVHKMPIRLKIKGRAGQVPHGLEAKSNPTFLFVFDYMSVFKRKNPIGLLKAYKEAFPKEGLAKLVIKVLNHKRDTFNHRRLLTELGDRSDISIVDKNLTPDKLRDLFMSCDCYISLHRSEGLGLTMAEAMSLNKLVVATGYSGNLDFMNDSNSVLIPYEMIKVGDDAYPYDPGSTWADPDLDQAARIMRSFKEAPEAFFPIITKGFSDAVEMNSSNDPASFIKTRLDQAKANY